MPLKPTILGPVPQEALAYFAAKKLHPGFSYLDVWKEEHNFAFTVAKLLEKDLLHDVQGSIEKALREGQPFNEWAKGTRDFFDRSGWSSYVAPEAQPSRLVNIYQTNMRVARSAGQWDRVQRTKRALPYLLYALGPSEHHRPEHAAWDGLVLPADDPWWDEHMPPNGWGCKCHVIQVSRTEADKRGGPDEAPDDGSYEWTNPKTGETESIPNGIDPGWNYNPGKARAQELADAEDEA